MPASDDATNGADLVQWPRSRAGTALGYWVAPAWLLVPGVVGLLMVQSYFPGFCPV